MSVWIWFILHVRRAAKAFYVRQYVKMAYVNELLLGAKSRVHISHDDHENDSIPGQYQWVRGPEPAFESLIVDWPLLCKGFIVIQVGHKLCSFHVIQAPPLQIEARATQAASAMLLQHRHFAILPFRGVLEQKRAARIKAAQQHPGYVMHLLLLCVDCLLQNELLPTTCCTSKGQEKMLLSLSLLLPPPHNPL